MSTEVKENTVKGNTTNVALVNFSNQNNVEINTENKIEIKCGIIELVKTFIDNKTYEYIGESKYKQKVYEYQLNQRIDQIPIIYQTNPRLSIVGPLLDNLKYNLDEEQIREMYTQILLSEIDTRKQDRVIPAYIDMIKQIDKNDALLLKKLKEFNETILTVINIKEKTTSDESNIVLNSYIVKNNESNYMEHYSCQPIYLDNLDRLNIIKLSNEAFYYLDDTSIADEILKHYKKSHNHSNNDYSIEICYFKITNFGQNFIDICCP